MIQKFFYYAVIDMHIDKHFRMQSKLQSNIFYLCKMLTQCQGHSWWYYVMQNVKDIHDDTT